MNHHEKILRGIIDDLMKVPMHGSHEGSESIGPKEAHVEVVATGKPSELDPDADADTDSMPGSKAFSHKMQMKKLHASSHGKKF